MRKKAKAKARPKAKATRAPKQGQLARTRQLVLDTTVEMLAARGYSSLTTEGISAQCGVARSTIYRHWQSVADIAMEAFLQIIGPPPPSPQTGNVRTDLAVNYRRLVDGLANSRWGKLLPAMLEASIRDKEFAQLLYNAFDSRRELGRVSLQKAVDRGELSPDTNFEWLLDSITGPIYHRLFFTARPLDEPGMIEYWVNSAVDGALNLRQDVRVASAGGEADEAA
jgi:AcrR family transcriptional regulator